MRAVCFLVYTAMGYAIARAARIQAVYADIVKADPIVKAMERAIDNEWGQCALDPDIEDTRAEWAAYLYSRYCGNGSVPMPVSSYPT